MSQKTGLIGANGVAAMSSLFRANCTDFETDSFVKCCLLKEVLTDRFLISKKYISYYDHAFSPGALARMQVILLCKKFYFVAHSLCGWALASNRKHTFQQGITQFSAVMSNRLSLNPTK